NAGPSVATGATITDIVPSQLTGVSWSCVAAGASSCGTASGTGDVNLQATVAAGPANGVAVTVTGTAPAGGSIDANTASVAAPPGTDDPDPGDNADTEPPVPVAPIVSIDSASGAEGTDVVFTVSLSGASATDVTVTLDTADGTATSPADYTAQSGLLVTVPAGSTSVPVAVPTVGDALYEGDETFTATLTNPVGASLGTATGTGTIVDDETPLTVSIDSASGAEGTDVVFTVSLSGASATDVTVTLDTADGTATSPADYTAQSGLLVTVPAGSTSVPVAVPTVGEARKGARVKSTQAQTTYAGASLGTATGTGTIVDDETPLTVSIETASGAEGRDDALSLHDALPISTDVTVTLDTADGTATSPADYTAQSGLLVTVPAGSTSVPVAVPTVG